METRRTRRLLVTVVALATTGGIAVPFAIGNAASGGGATAQAAYAHGAVSATSDDVQASTPLVNAPTDPGIASTSTDLNVSDGGSNASIVTSTATASATNDPDSYSAESRLTGVRVTIQGTPLLSVRELTADVRCDIAKAATAHVVTTDLVVAGSPVPVPEIPSYSQQIPLPGGGSATVSLGQTASSGTEGAAAQALRIHVDVTDSSGASNDLDVVLAAATCQAPTAPAGPAVTAMTPTHGPTTGGTTVTLTGSGLDDATAVNLCDVAITDLNVNADGTSLTFDTPPCDAGARPVTVTGSADTATAPGDFTYDAPGTEAAPSAADSASIDAIEPRQGSTEGGTPVTLSGSQLQSVRSISICGATITELEVASDGSAVTFTTPPCDAGDEAVAAGFGDGSTLGAPHDFTYIAPASGAETAADTATITGLNPTSGPVDGGTKLAITGSRLDHATTVTLCGTTLRDLDVSADGSQILVPTPKCSPGPRIPVVQFADGSRRGSAQAFTYIGAAGGTASGGANSGGATGGGGVAPSTPKSLAGSDTLPHTGTSIARLAVPGSLAIVAAMAIAAWRRRSLIDEAR